MLKMCMSLSYECMWMKIYMWRMMWNGKRHSFVVNVPCDQESAQAVRIVSLTLLLEWSV